VINDWSVRAHLYVLSAWAHEQIRGNPAHFLFSKGTAQFVIGPCCTMIQKSLWWSDLPTTEFIVLPMFGEAAATRSDRLRVARACALTLDELGAGSRTVRVVAATESPLGAPTRDWAFRRCCPISEIRPATSATQSPPTTSARRTAPIRTSSNDWRVRINVLAQLGCRRRGYTLAHV
jgi:hypothetical protein